MKKIIMLLFAGMFLLVISGISLAADKGSKAEAEAMVKKAIVYLKEAGKEKALAEISNPKGKFIDRDLYVFVYDMNGKVLAHGFNQKMIGKDLIDMKDPDGKFFVKERIEIAKTKGKGWQEYKFTDPKDKKIDDKTAYIEKYEDMIIGCGAYKN